jgi:hypothetical protein
VKIFHCQNCGQMVYFANTRCERCGLRLGYLSDRALLSALVPLVGGHWSPLAAPTQHSRFCANAVHDVCNWLIPADGLDAFCQACQLNRTIPDLGHGENRRRWQRLEAAKHRLVYGLLRLGLPLTNRFDAPETGLAFDFLATSDGVARGRTGVVTGHAAGQITIDIAEADDAERERHRQAMGESYRTLLGHFRHEIGHYYWDRLVHSGPWIEAFRNLFGDERWDYEASLRRHYGEGPPADWQQRFVSGYASAHPWEDFAETWAHYLHILDTLETAFEFGLRVRPRGETDPTLIKELDADPYVQQEFDHLIALWLPLTYGVNCLNHSMGLPDLYPFVLSPAVMGKLRFVHGLVFPPSAIGTRPL